MSRASASVQVPGYRQRLEIAVKAKVDPRTVASYFADGQVRDASRAAIDRALRAMSLATYIRTETAA